MSAFAPLGRLLAHPRVWVGASGILFWAGFSGWVAAMIRFARVEEVPRDPALIPLVVGSAVVMLPAACGVLASEAIAELLRVPLARLLPRIRAELSRSTAAHGALAAAVCSIAALWRPGLSPLAAFGPALLGFAAGVWSTGVVLPGWRFAGALLLPFAAEPLCAAAGASPFAAVLMALAAALALHLRFHPAVVRASAGARGMFLTFLSRDSYRAREHGREAWRARRSGSTALPPEQLGGSVTGWMRARRFEQRTAGGLGTVGALLRFALFCLVIAVVGPIVTGLVDGESGSLRGISLLVTDALVGLPAVETEADDSVVSTVVLVLWMLSAISALISATPLVGAFLYPLGRAMRARLAWRSVLQAVCVQTVLVLALGGVVGGALLLALGEPWPRALPVFAWAALANLLLSPLVIVAGVLLARKSESLRGVKAFYAFLAVMAVPAGILLGLWSLWRSLPREAPALGIAAVYAAALALGLFGLRRFLRWHYATCDLAR